MFISNVSFFLLTEYPEARKCHSCTRFRNGKLIYCHLTLTLLVATCLLITFANSLDPDQAQQNVGPDLDPNCLPL